MVSFFLAVAKVFSSFSSYSSPSFVNYYVFFLVCIVAANRAGLVTKYFSISSEEIPKCLMESPEATLRNQIDFIHKLTRILISAFWRPQSLFRWCPSALSLEILDKIILSPERLIPTLFVWNILFGIYYDHDIFIAYLRRGHLVHRPCLHRLWPLITPFLWFAHSNISFNQSLITSFLVTRFIAN